MLRTGAEVMEKKGQRARGLTRLAVLCLPVAAALVLPSVASAAAGGSTVRATVGGDGSVKSVKVYAPGGGTSSFNGELPIKVSISRTVSGNTSTYTYHVENTFSKTQTVTYKDTAGKTHSATTDIQLPLVAQLGVELPKSFKDVSATQGVVETNPDGINRILYQLVLFSPLGSPTQDVTFTATGSGAPTMELSAVAVNPSTTSGLSASGQDANASSQQDDFWAGYASGGNGGLTQLADGMGKLVAGLQQATPGAHQLADGLGAAGDGANKLDAGTAQAHTGSVALSKGIGQIHSGQSQLTGGLSLIHGGLGTLDGKDAGNPGLQGAVDGLGAIEGGVKLIEGGLAGPGGTGLTPKAPSVLDGLTHVSATPTDPATPPGLVQSIDLIKAGLTPLASGLDCSNVFLNSILKGTVAIGLAGTQNPCYAAAGFPNGTVPVIAAATDPFAIAILTGMTDPNSATGVPAAAAGVHGLVDSGGTFDKIHFGLTHSAGTLNAQDPGGLVQVLTSMAIGLDSHTPGTYGPTDKGGIDFGLLALLDPAKGLPAAVSGVDKLFAGSGDALSGSQKLTAGSGQALTGSQQLASGLGQLSAGQHQVATGLPAAVTGSQQLASGLDQITAGAVQVHDGIKAVQSGAVSPLLTQLTSASLNAKKQLAILDAATTLGSQAPGGQGTSYVLTQSKTGFRLAAASSPASSSSNTGRNVGIGLGGLVVLVIAVGAGFALGRRSSSVSA